MLTASDLWALSHSTRNVGDEKCYWCGSKCKQLWLHGDPPPIPGIRNTARKLTKCPGSSWICIGCWQWQWTRVTITFLSQIDQNGKKTIHQQDGKTAKNFSWLITETHHVAIGENDYKDLLKILLKPPLRFCLMLQQAEEETLLQAGYANDNEEVKASTPLKFTLGNVLHEYTIYDLENLIKTGEDSSPGSRILADYLGVSTPAPKEKQEPKKAGRPFKEMTKTPDNLVTGVSGS